MSKPKQQRSKAKKNKVRVESLPQQDGELKASETRNIKGGGGAPGGVLQGKNSLTRSIGEEIPQRG